MIRLVKFSEEAAAERILWINFMTDIKLNVWELSLLMNRNTVRATCREMLPSPGVFITLQKPAKKMNDGLVRQTFPQSPHHT